MTPETISFSIIASFMVILLFGFLFGLARGFNKSLVRAIIVIACLVITFFSVPALTKTAMTVNISNFNITINGQVMTNVGEVLSASLANVPYIADLAGTQAFATILNVVPQMIVNVVLFILMFYVLRLISMNIYWIIAGICFSKKKTKGKSKHRILGSFVGVVQNFVIFLVLLVPCVGIINIISEVDSRVPESPKTEQVSTTSSVIENGESANSEGNQGDQNNQENNDNSNGGSITDNINTALDKVSDVVAAYKDNWVYKTLHAVKLDSACNYVFNKLTTVKVNKEQYVLKNEVLSLTDLAVDFSDLQAKNGEEFKLDENTITKIEKLIVDAYNSKLTGNLIDEIVPTAVNKWNAGETFMGIKKPTVEGYEDVLEDVFKKLGEPGSKKQLLLSTTKMARSLVKAADSISNANGELNLETIGTLLSDITSDPEVMDLAKTIVVNNIETIANKILDGQENQYVKVVVEAVETIFGADYSQEQNDLSKEIDVITTTLGVADKLMKNDPENKLSQEDANKVVQSIAQSTVIFDTLKLAESDISKTMQDLLAENQEAKDMVKTSLENLETVEGISTEKIDALYNIFGITKGEEVNPPVEG